MFTNMGTYGAAWAHMVPHGAIWYHIGKYGRMCAHMGPRGAIWYHMDHMTPCATMWAPMAPYGPYGPHGPTWCIRNLMVSCSHVTPYRPSDVIWCHLVPYGATWCHMVSCCAIWVNWATWCHMKPGRCHVSPLAVHATCYRQHHLTPDIQLHVIRQTDIRAS